MTETTKEPVYASKAKPWLKYYDEKYIHQTVQISRRDSTSSMYSRMPSQEFAAQSRLFHRGQKMLNVMPPFIAYGYSCGIHMPLVMGLHIIIIPNLDPDKLGALVWKHKPAHMFGVPTHRRAGGRRARRRGCAPCLRR